MSKINSLISSGKMLLILMAIPCVMALIAFSYIPLFGWIIAFFDYKPGLVLFDTKFVGLKWFAFAFNDYELLLVLRNTLALSFLGLLAYPLAILFAIFLMEMSSIRFRKVIQILTTLPNFISWVLVFSIAYAFLSSGDGIVNKVLLNLNLISAPLNPLANPEIVWTLQTAILIWKTLGFSAIIYIAAIVGIDQELYEAAAIDGAGRYQKMWNITIPGIIPTFVTLLLLGIGNILNTGFEQYYLFKNPLTQSTIEVLDLYVYRIGITLNNFPMSTAIGMTKTIISVLLLFTANYLSKKLRDQSII